MESTYLYPGSTSYSQSKKLPWETYGTSTYGWDVEKKKHAPTITKIKQKILDNLKIHNFS